MHKIVAIFVTALLLSAGNLSAQDCLKIESDPPAATLTVSGDVHLSTASPGLYCTLTRGRAYSLSVWSPSHEKRLARFKIKDDGDVAFSGNWMGYTASSAILPGWGQASQGYSGRSAEAVGSVGSAGVRTYTAWKRYDNELKNYDYFTYLYERSSNQSQREDLRDQANLAAANSEAYRDHLIYTAAFAGLWYLGNLFETYGLSAPARSSQREDGTYELRIPRKSKKRAVFRSFFWPGMGQKYNGDRGKSFLFQWGFIVLGYYTFDRYLQYQLRDADYQLWNDKFRNATNEVDKERYRVQAAIRWDSRDKRRTEALLFGAATGAVWLMNVIDAAVFGGAEELPNRFDVETSFDSKTLRTGIKVAF